MQKIIKKTIFEKDYGRPNIIKKISQRFIEILTMKLSKKHISKNRKQLVVFSFDYIALRINIDGIYELEELDTFFSWIAKYGEEVFNGVALDIGANIGNHSLYFSDYFKKVYSFEPVRRTFKVLCLNSELAENITCFNVGLSDTEKTTLIKINPTNMGGAEIGNKKSVYNEIINLKSLDSLVNLSENIKMIKIDVEGHEYEVLIGAEKVIKKNYPIILFEQHKNDFINGESKVISLIKSYGYSHFVIIQKSPKSSIKLNQIQSQIYTVTSRLLFGSSMQINMQDEFSPDFYPFIVALPKWINLKTDTFIN